MSTNSYETQHLTWNSDVEVAHLAAQLTWPAPVAIGKAVKGLFAPSDQFCFIFLFQKAPPTVKLLLFLLP